MKPCRILFFFSESLLQFGHFCIPIFDCFLLFVSLSGPCLGPDRVGHVVVCTLCKLTIYHVYPSENLVLKISNRVVPIRHSESVSSRKLMRLEYCSVSSSVVLHLSLRATFFLCTSGDVSQVQHASDGKRAIEMKNERIFRCRLSNHLRLWLCFLVIPSKHVLELVPLLILLWLLESPTLWRWVCVPSRRGMQTHVLFRRHDPCGFDAVVLLVPSRNRNGNGFPEHPFQGRHSSDGSKHFPTFQRTSEITLRSSESSDEASKNLVFR